MLLSKAIFRGKCANRYTMVLIVFIIYIIIIIVFSFVQISINLNTPSSCMYQVSSTHCCRKWAAIRQAPKETSPPWAEWWKPGSRVELSSGQTPPPTPLLQVLWQKNQNIHRLEEWIFRVFVYCTKGKICLVFYLYLTVGGDISNLPKVKKKNLNYWIEFLIFKILIGFERSLMYVMTD